MQPAPTTPNPGNGPTQPGASAQTRPISGRIAAVLHVIRVLIAHAQYFAANVSARAAEPQFATAAAVFGTYDLAVIRFRMRRGIRRALALQRYLLARAARGIDLRFAWPPYLELLPHHRPPVKPRAKPTKPRRASQREPSLLPDENPRAFYLPTDAEFDREVARRPVGLSITYILLDLGVVPGFCDGEFWNKIYNVLRRYGGNINQFYAVRTRRAETFERERHFRPETWDINWRDLNPANVRKALGCLVGESQLPAIVPS